MMSDKVVFWFAALVGVVLTIGWLYVLLLGQPGTSILIEPPVSKNSDEAGRTTPSDASASTNSAPSEKPSPVPQVFKKEVVPDASLSNKVEAVPRPEAIVVKKAVAKPAAKEMPEAVLPELNLSEAEIQALSPEDRERYERLLQSYQDVRGRMSRLDQEKAQLQHRIENMSERNEQMEGELQELREGLNK